MPLFTELASVAVSLYMLVSYHVSVTVMFGVHVEAPLWAQPTSINLTPIWLTKSIQLYLAGWNKQDAERMPEHTTDSYGSVFLILTQPQMKCTPIFYVSKVEN